jgi:hypothetical protein
MQETNKPPHRVLVKSIMTFEGAVGQNVCRILTRKAHSWSPRSPPVPKIEESHQIVPVVVVLFHK